MTVSYNKKRRYNNMDVSIKLIGLVIAVMLIVFGIVELVQ